MQLGDGARICYLQYNERRLRVVEIDYLQFALPPSAGGVYCDAEDNASEDPLQVAPQTAIPRLRCGRGRNMLLVGAVTLLPVSLQSAFGGSQERVVGG